MAEEIQKKEISQKLANLLMICNKAGKLAFGVDVANKLLHQNKVFCIILSLDLAQKTRQKIVSRCENGKVPCFSHGSMEAYGLLFNRRATGILSIKDRNFAQGICKIMAKSAVNI